MTEIPASLIAFQRRFPDDDACGATPCSAKRLQTCLDEFVFRFNRRRNRHTAFLSLFLQALRAKPQPCHILIKPEPSA